MKVTLICQIICFNTGRDEQHSLTTGILISVCCCYWVQ